MRIEENASLQSYNTLRVAARARYLVHLESLDDVRAFAREPRFRKLRRLILGGGSNLLLRGDFDGVVGRVALRGIEQVHSDAGATDMRAAAGEDWHGFVMHTIEHGHAGLENLSLIPGTVGGAPIQNIGAYGVELSAVLHSVETVAAEDGSLRTFTPAECELGYRDSVFKHRASERYIVTAITVRLPREPHYVTHYRGVAEELERMGVTAPDAGSISRAVCNIRRRKLPDPAEIGNAGSFFKNPVLDEAALAALHARHPDVPAYRQPAGGYKIPAAWLIEQCGWKGHREGDAGIYAQHALVLVNHGSASGKALAALAARVSDSVRERFGITLEIEPLLV